MMIRKTLGTQLQLFKTSVGTKRAHEVGLSQLSPLLQEDLATPLKDRNLQV
jgi:hypothetical protein